MSGMDVHGTLTFDAVPEGARYCAGHWELAPRGLVRLLTPLAVRMGRRQEAAIWAGPQALPRGAGGRLRHRPTRREGRPDEGGRGVRVAVGKHGGRRPRHRRGGPDARALSTAEAVGDAMAGVDLIVAGGPVLGFKLPAPSRWNKARAPTPAAGRPDRPISRTRQCIRGSTGCRPGTATRRHSTRTCGVRSARRRRRSPRRWRRRAGRWRCRWLRGRRQVRPPAQGRTGAGAAMGRRAGRSHGLSGRAAGEELAAATRSQASVNAPSDGRRRRATRLRSSGSAIPTRWRSPGTGTPRPKPK